MPILYSADVHHKIAPLHTINFVNLQPMCHVDNDMFTHREYFYICYKRATRQVLPALTSRIGRVTNFPGFSCLLVLSHPGLPFSSYAGLTGVQYSTRHLPVSAKLIYLLNKIRKFTYPAFHRR